MRRELVFDLQSKELTFDLSKKNELSYSVKQNNLIYLLLNVVREYCLEMYGDYILKDESAVDVDLLRLLDIKIEDVYKLIDSKVVDCDLLNAIEIKFEDDEVVDYYFSSPSVRAITSFPYIEIKDHFKVKEVMEAMVSLVKEAIDCFFNALDYKVTSDEELSINVKDIFPIEQILLDTSVKENVELKIDLNELIELIIKSKERLVESTAVNLEYYKVSKHTLSDIDDTYLSDLDNLNLNQV